MCKSGGPVVIVVCFRAQHPSNKKLIFLSQNWFWAFRKFLCVPNRAKSVFPRVGVSAQGHYEKLAFKDEFLFEKSV